MNIGIGIVIGLIIGAIATYLLSASVAKRKLQSTESKLDRTEKALQETDAQLKESQQAYARIQDIEQQYQAQTDELKQVKAKLADLESATPTAQEILSVQTQLQETEQAYEQRIQGIEQTYQTHIQELENNHQQAIADLENTHQTQISELQAHIRELQQAQTDEIKALQNESPTTDEVTTTDTIATVTAGIAIVGETITQDEIGDENLTETPQEEAQEAPLETLDASVEQVAVAELTTQDENRDENLTETVEEIPPLETSPDTNDDKIDNLLEELPSDEIDNNNLLEDLSLIETASDKTEEEIHAAIEQLSDWQDATQDAGNEPKTIVPHNDAFDGLFEDAQTNADADFLEMMPTQEETVTNFDSSLASDENDPFADLFESDNEPTPQHSDDPFAELLGNQSEQPDEEFLNLLQADDDAGALENQSSTHQNESEWDKLFDDSTAQNQESDDPFQIEEMLESSKSHTTSS